MRLLKRYLNNASELFFLIFVLSGVLKDFLYRRVNPIYIDLTLIFAILMTTVLIVNFKETLIKLKASFGSRPIQIFLVFVLYMLTTLLYTSSDGYSWQKVIYFQLNTIAFLYPILAPSFNLKKFVNGFIIVVSGIGIMSVLSYAFYLNNLSGLLSFTPEFYQSLYLNVGGFLGVAIILTLTKNYSRPVILLLWFLALCLWFTAARGPIIFALMVLLVYLINLFYNKNVKENTKNFLKTNRASLLTELLFGILIIVTTVFSPYLNQLHQRALYRFGGIVPSEEIIEKSGILSQHGNINLDDIAFAGNHSSTSIRMIHILFTKEMVLASPEAFLFGYGIGSYGYEFEGMDERLYPHNMILEVWFETGLIGVLLLLFFFVAVLKVCIQNRQFLLSLVILYLLLNAMKSNALEQHRVLFAFIGLAMAIPSKDQFPEKLKSLLKLD